MPIRPENRLRYPRDWKTVIVPRIRERSGNRCECSGQCGEQHGPDADGRCLRINGEIGYWDKPADGHWVRLAVGKKNLGIECEIADLIENKRPICIVLTVMHLNHEPEDCRDENLLHACQGCHNRYDAPIRRASLKARAHAKRAVGDLFCDSPG